MTQRNTTSSSSNRSRRKRRSQINGIRTYIYIYIKPNVHSNREDVWKNETEETRIPLLKLVANGQFVLKSPFSFDANRSFTLNGLKIPKKKKHTRRLIRFYSSYMVSHTQMCFRADSFNWCPANYCIFTSNWNHFLQMNRSRQSKNHSIFSQDYLK